MRSAALQAPLEGKGMVRRVTFSFHYDLDVRRIVQMRDSWVIRPGMRRGTPGRSDRRSAAREEQQQVQGTRPYRACVRRAQAAVGHRQSVRPRPAKNATRALMVLGLANVYLARARRRHECACMTRRARRGFQTGSGSRKSCLPNAGRRFMTLAPRRAANPPAYSA